VLFIDALPDQSVPTYDSTIYQSGLARRKQVTVIGRIKREGAPYRANRQGKPTLAATA
jgi:hypothetical protein